MRYSVERSGGDDMKRAAFSFMFVVLGLMLLIQGCDVEVTYDIKVINDTDSSFSVYLDDVLQFKLAAGGSSTIRNVEDGAHTLEARNSSGIVAERVVDLDSDMEWTVFVERYELTVFNEAGLDFAFYLDGVFQFDIEYGEGITLTDVSEGIHTLEARIGDIIIADETVDVNQDLEWEVF